LSSGILEADGVAERDEAIALDLTAYLDGTLDWVAAACKGKTRLGR
jgi:hypothetical protein